VIDEFGYLLEADPGLDSTLASLLGPAQRRAGTGGGRLLLCGSAIAMMRNLGAGQAPLRGRAALELVLRAFGYRQAAAMLGPAPDLALADRLFAVIGSVIGYATDMVDDDLPRAVGWPTSVLSEIRVSDGNSWHAQTTGPAKFRLYAPAATATSAVVGAGKPGTYGVPTVGFSGWPTVGNPLDIWLDNAARAQPALLLIGWPIPGGIQFPFATVYVTADNLLVMQTKTHTSPTAGALS
jgi:hypothetical protein